MAISLTVVGIPAWSWKRRLLLFAKKHPNLVEIKTEGVCHECSRHLQLLKYFDGGEIRIDQSEYFKYQRKNKKSKKAVYSKIRKFKELYEKAKKGDVGYPVITDDGCRLDGSHRCAIAVHLSEPILLVNMVSYEDRFKASHCKKIRNQVRDYRKKAYNL